MFHRAVLLDISVSTVMVGQYQSFGRNDLSGTSSSKVYDCIFQADIVRAVYLVDGDIQSQVLHHSRILLLQVGQHPHSLVRMGGEGECGK